MNVINLTDSVPNKPMGIGLYKDSIVRYEQFGDNMVYLHTNLSEGKSLGTKVKASELKYINENTISSQLVFPNKIFTTVELDSVKSFEEIGTLEDVKLYLMQASNIMRHVLGFSDTNEESVEVSEDTISEEIVEESVSTTVNEVNAWIEKIHGMRRLAQDRERSGSLTVNESEYTIESPIVELEDSDSTVTNSEIPPQIKDYYDAVSGLTDRGVGKSRGKFFFIEPNDEEI